MFGKLERMYYIAILWNRHCIVWFETQQTISVKTELTCIFLMLCFSRILFVHIAASAPLVSLVKTAVLILTTVRG